MRVIAKRALREFWMAHPDSQGPPEAWHAEVRKATWTKTANIRERYRSVDFIEGNRVVFNIGGNKYRLIVHVRYDIGFVYVRFIGTHAEYSKIDAKEV